MKRPAALLNAGLAPLPRGVRSYGWPFDTPDRGGHNAPAILKVKR